MVGNGKQQRDLVLYVYAYDRKQNYIGAARNP